MLAIRAPLPHGAAKPEHFFGDVLLVNILISETQDVPLPLRVSRVDVLIGSPLNFLDRSVRNVGKFPHKWGSTFRNFALGGYRAIDRPPVVQIAVDLRELSILLSFSEPERLIALL